MDTDELVRRIKIAAVHAEALAADYSTKSEAETVELRRQAFVATSIAYNSIASMLAEIVA